MCRGSVTVQDGQRGAFTTVPLANTKDQMQNLTMQQLKERVMSEVPGIRGKTDIQLLFKGHTLAADSSTLSQHGIKDKDIIVAVPKVHGG